MGDGVFISLFIVAVFAGCMLAAAWSDLTSMTIPNRISLVLFAGFLAASALVQPGWSVFGTHMLVGLSCFAIGVGMFALGWMGGGDAKLFAATAFWFTWPDLLVYVVYASIGGGVLALFLLLGRSFLPVQVLTTDWMHRLFRDEKKMPYGLALAFGALMTLPRSEFYQFAASLT
ncbi:MAG TPA: peptidase [Hellea balneolensis]|uniref:Peptidase n=1 Tax=Hellea balneolensis TaxID=287478 RepID=A0A7C5R479_9PROT|nr:peptidase [Hellea balneolensis]